MSAISNPELITSIAKPKKGRKKKDTNIPDSEKPKKGRKSNANEIIDMPNVNADISCGLSVGKEIANAPKTYKSRTVKVMLNETNTNVPKTVTKRATKNIQAVNVPTPNVIIGEPNATFKPVTIANDDTPPPEIYVNPDIDIIKTLNLDTTLSHRGYELVKSQLPPKLLTNLKKELIVAPKASEYNDDIHSFEQYYEGDTGINDGNMDKITIPRFFGVKKFGEPKKNLLGSNRVNFAFTGNLRDYQIDIKQKCINHLLTEGGGLLSLGCGQGKCLARGTLIMMHDGTVKKVEDVKHTEKLMGDDSTPRNILSLARGKEEMYVVRNMHGPYDEQMFFLQEYYIVNLSHILSLKVSSTKPVFIKNVFYPNSSIVDISVKDFLDLDIDIRYKLKGYRVPIDFTYYIPDKQVTDEEAYDLGYRLVEEKHTSIPNYYKLNSKSIRRSLIAGILDKGAIYRYNIISLDAGCDTLKMDILFILRSLGIYCRIYNPECKFMILTDLVFGLNISGNELQHLPLKKINLNKYVDETADLCYDIQLESVGRGDYYGFEIDQNRRFVLGDFTVTHNTVIALDIAASLGMRTIVFTHKTFLQDQWIERATQFTNAKIGIIRQNIIQWDGYDIVIGMAQSISMKDYGITIFDNFDMVILDESHHYGSRVFSRIMHKCGGKYMLALSATPNRADGLAHIIHWHIGDVIYKQKPKPNDQVIAKIFKYESTDKLFVEKKMWCKGKMLPSNTMMINNLVEIKSRNNHIINIINELRKSPLRKILILSGRREHLTVLKDAVDAQIKQDVINGKILEGECNTDYYMGGMKPKERQRAEHKGDILFGTYDMAHEGLDIDRLNTIILATPKKNVTQAIGRIIRKILQNGDIRPVIIDLSDMLSIFPGQGDVRMREYAKNKYKTETYYLRDDKIRPYFDYIKETMNLTDEEVKIFMEEPNPDAYEPNLASILNLSRVDNDNSNCLVADANNK